MCMDYSGDYRAKGGIRGVNGNGNFFFNVLDLMVT